MTAEQAQRIREAPACFRHAQHAPLPTLYWARTCDSCLAIVCAAALPDEPTDWIITAAVLRFRQEAPDAAHELGNVACEHIMRRVLTAALRAAKEGA